MRDATPKAQEAKVSVLLLSTLAVDELDRALRTTTREYQARPYDETKSPNSSDSSSSHCPEEHAAAASATTSSSAVNEDIKTFAEAWSPLASASESCRCRSASTAENGLATADLAVSVFSEAVVAHSRVCMSPSSVPPLPPLCVSELLLGGDTE